MGHPSLVAGIEFAGFDGARPIVFGPRTPGRTWGTRPVSFGCYYVRMIWSRGVDAYHAACFDENW